MRVITRRIAGLEDGGWDAESRRVVLETFDMLAPEWHSRIRPQSIAVVRDALERGLDAGEHGTDVCLEIGAGIGAYSGLFGERFGTSVAIDISYEMMRLAPHAPAHRVVADAGLLPVSDGAADAVILINAFLFPEEIDRVLSDNGALLWVNSSGADTPIHLSTDEVVTALPFDVDGLESQAGAGTWCALWRDLPRRPQPSTSGNTPRI